MTPESRLVTLAEAQGRMLRDCLAAKGRWSARLLAAQDLGDSGGIARAGYKLGKVARGVDICNDRLEATLGILAASGRKAEALRLLKHWAERSLAVERACFAEESARLALVPASPALAVIHAETPGTTMEAA